MGDSFAANLDEGVGGPAEATDADERRRKLLVLTCAAGGAAAAAAVWPFLASMVPSERVRALGAPVEADISGLEPGAMTTVEWQGKPVWIVNRTKEMLASLERSTRLLADPDSKRSEQPDHAKNPHRSIKPEYLLVVGICTHLGCSPTPRFRPGEAGMGVDWPGGFLCPCHGSRFDLSARVYANIPAPTNLAVPRYKYRSDTRILIGDDEKGA